MTKIWLLYDNPWDEGDDVYGAFSTEEKANEAHEIFSEVAKHDLYIREMEIDDLEQYYDRVKSGYGLYIGHKSRHHYPPYPVRYGEWGFDQLGLDSFFEKEKADYVVEMDSYVSAHIKAKSEKEAEEIADKIFNEKGEGYNIWLINPSTS